MKTHKDSTHHTQLIVLWQHHAQVKELNTATTSIAPAVFCLYSQSIFSQTLVLYKVHSDGQVSLKHV